MESREPHDGEAKEKEDEEEEQKDDEDRGEEEEELGFFDAVEFLPAPHEEPPTDSPSLPPLESTSALSSPSPSDAPSLLRRRRCRRTPSASSDQIVGSSSDPRRNILPASEGPEIDLGSSSIPPGQLVDRGDGRPETSNLDRERGVTADGDGTRRRLGFLGLVAEAVIMAVFYFVALLTGLFILPIRLFRTAYRIVTEPFHVLRRGRDAVRLRCYRFFRALFDRVHPWLLGNRIGPQQAWNWLVRLAKGCFWSLYVCIVLSSLVATSSLAAFLIVLHVVEAPIRMTEELNFDYALPRPQALVPITALDGCLVSDDKIDDLEVLRLVPPKHKLQLAILLTLPESDYNKKLGIFQVSDTEYQRPFILSFDVSAEFLARLINLVFQVQVRVELLTPDGNVSSSSWRPCVLHFKSFQFQLLEMFLKSVFMLTGYSSESQVLMVQMNGLTEGRKPTVCIRVTLEQRAGYGAGAGIPEIYSAHMKLESELPLVKRIIWNWKITLFIWTTMALFNLQLLTLLLCCRPILFPRVRRVDLPVTHPPSGGNGHPPSAAI
ncbi:hypothetical protein ZIOFF_040556 [Zingiber officinale]|uniref:Seipin n=1 Tax=Zingiber officinale TaxID=94328 RepID=A0A8J5G6D9_ZINOF|nr:hypothetical protein ZIOFF_040556 [Zingiber officinale]